MIYAVEILNCKFVKIGFADDVERRIAGLQTGSPFKINLLFAVSGTLRQEKAIHAALTAAFARIRIPMPPNEWYPGRNTFFKFFLSELKRSANFGLKHAENWNVAVNQPSEHWTIDIAPNVRWPEINEVGLAAIDSEHHEKPMKAKTIARLKAGTDRELQRNKLRLRKAATEQFRVQVDAAPSDCNQSVIQ